MITIIINIIFGFIALLMGLIPKKQSKNDVVVVDYITIYTKFFNIVHMKHKSYSKQERERVLKETEQLLKELYDIFDEWRDNLPQLMKQPNINFQYGGNINWLRFKDLMNLYELEHLLVYIKNMYGKKSDEYIKLKKEVDDLTNDSKKIITNMVNEYNNEKFIANIICDYI